MTGGNSGGKGSPEGRRKSLLRVPESPFLHVFFILMSLQPLLLVLFQEGFEKIDGYGKDRRRILLGGHFSQGLKES